LLKRFRTFLVSPRRFRPRFAALGLGVVAVGCLNAAGAQAVERAPAGPAPMLTVTTAANPRPQLISGSETLIRVRIAPSTDRTRLHVTENGQNITSAFVAEPDGSLLGLAANLHRGTDIVTSHDAMPSRLMANGQPGMTFRNWLDRQEDCPFTQTSGCAFPEICRLSVSLIAR
jgi:hypothetical protein